MSERTWRERIEEVMGDDDSFKNVVSMQPSHGKWLDREWREHGDNGRFVIWTKKWIYFHIDIDTYDGSIDSLDSIPRHPLTEEEAKAYWRTREI